MNIRVPLLISIGLIAIMLVVSAWGWTVLPANVHMAIHWDLSGKPNGFAGRQIGLFALPALAAGFAVFCALLPSFEPRREHLAASRQLYYAGWMGTLVVLMGIHIVSTLAAAGLPLDVPAITLMLIAVLMVVLGNFLSKSRSMFFLGARWPWSLSSELAWEKSNRAAAYCYVATGLVTIAALFVLGVQAGFLVLLTGIVLGTLAGAVVSFIYWRREQNGGE